MQIRNEEFKKIMEYVSTKLLESSIHAGSGKVVSELAIKGIPSILTLDDFLQTVGEKKEKAKTTPIEDDKGFELFWNTYPATPTFRYKGRTFTDSRTLRSNKMVCRNKYLNYLHDHPEVTPELILKALRIQLKMAKDESVQDGYNRLARWNGLEVYINQAKFEPFIEMAMSEEDFGLGDESSSASYQANNTSSNNYA